MLKNHIFEVVDKENIPTGTKLVDSTWAFKLKSNATIYRRLNTRGFKQVDGQFLQYQHPYTCYQYVGGNISTVLVLMRLVYVKVTEGQEGFYPTNQVLLLLRNADVANPNASQEVN